MNEEWTRRGNQTNSLPPPSAGSLLTWIPQQTTPTRLSAGKCTRGLNVQRRQKEPKKRGAGNTEIARPAYGSETHTWSDTSLTSRKTAPGLRSFSSSSAQSPVTFSMVSGKDRTAGRATSRKTFAKQTPQTGSSPLATATLT